MLRGRCQTRRGPAAAFRALQPAPFRSCPYLPRGKRDGRTGGGLRRGARLRPLLSQLGPGAPTGGFPMDFDYSPRQREWMKRVSDFMDQHVYPAEETYAAQMLEARDKGNPWIVVPVVEELKKKAKAQGPVEPVPQRERTRRRPDQSRICAAVRNDGQGRLRAPKCSTAPRRTPATWKCWSATATQCSRSSG